MQQAQVLAYGIEERLADQLRKWAQDQGVWFRPLRQAKSCIKLLQHNPQAVLLLRVGRDLEKELTLLERVKGLFPESPTIVIGEGDNPLVAGLAWDLGARYVMFAPITFDLLAEIILGFLPSGEKPAERANT